MTASPRVATDGAQLRPAKLAYFEPVLVASVALWEAVAVAVVGVGAVSLGTCLRGRAGHRRLGARVMPVSCLLAARQEASYCSDS